MQFYANIIKKVLKAYKKILYSFICIHICYYIEKEMIDLSKCAMKKRMTQ